LRGRKEKKEGDKHGKRKGEKLTKKLNLRRKEME